MLYPVSAPCDTHTCPPTADDVITFVYLPPLSTEQCHYILNSQLIKTHKHTCTHSSCIPICLPEHYTTCPCRVMALSVGRESFITIKITHSECVCFAVRVKRNHAAVSYHCTIGNMKTQQGAEPKPQVWLSDDFGELRRVGLDLRDVVPLHLKSLRLHAATTVFLPFKSRVTKKTQKKSLNCETGEAKRLTAAVCFCTRREASHLVSATTVRVCFCLC